MIIECSYCQKKLNIPPNANLPVGRPFTFVCPNCKMKNTVTLEDPNAGIPNLDDSPPRSASPQAPSQGPMGAPPLGPPQGSMGPPPQAPPSASQMGYGQPPQQRESKSLNAGMIPGYNVSEAQSLMALADGPEGLKTALVIYDNEEIQNMLEEKLSSMGYKVSLALNVRDAAKQLKFGAFQVVLLQEDYYGATVKNNQLLKAINSLEVRIRHKMFIGLIGPSFTSLDDLMAFSLSLDTVINTRDLEDIEKLLISAIGHVSKFFATYNELRAQRGVE